MEAERPLNVSNDVRVGEYWLKSKVGENCLCTVWKAEHVLSGEVVAVKQIYLYKLNKHLKTCLDCELNFLSSVNHPNIIRLFNVFQVTTVVSLWICKSHGTLIMTLESSLFPYGFLLVAVPKCWAIWNGADRMRIGAEELILYSSTDIELHVNLHACMDEECFISVALICLGGAYG
ncbi:hypothetical protein LWI29_034343 [Acer saccharum]|uniref:Protein kinase domain-containing protein n=1 Tax=Acer saccharum TaxID=4024 RepID=A0AA39W182_ACESA|nr:hypothetical protein LWI29_034343 [Acer saccharum]